MDGWFELIVSEKLATYMMRVSAVGYASAEMKVYEARDKGEVQILLKPVTYGIGEVDVTDVYKRQTRDRDDKSGSGCNFDLAYRYHEIFRTAK